MLPFLMLFVSLPFGIGIQSSALFACFLYILITQRKALSSLKNRLVKVEWASIILLSAVILTQIIATLLNAKNPQRDVVSFAAGFLPLVLLPPLFRLLPRVGEADLKKIERYIAISFTLWAVLAFSQNVWGWKISGVSLVTGDHFKRAQGLYSHPLTLAYVALMLWPLSLGRFLERPKDLFRILPMLSTLALLYFSASRTAQGVAFLVLFAMILWQFRGRVRWILIGLTTVFVITVLATPNMVSRRIMNMSSGQISEEKESGYADDRIAFWIVHLNMVKERPLLGHGIHLDKDYRMPYYEAIGLPDFKKAYEAHNQVLQLAAEGGIFSALAFLAWLASLHFHGRTLPRILQKVRDLTLIALLLGGLTQNAYFDGEVRFVLALLLALMFAYRARTDDQAPLPSNFKE